MIINQDKESVRQVVLGFTEMFKGMTGNQELKIPDEIADKLGINPDGTLVKDE
jgi:hypothetical protein